MNRAQSTVAIAVFGGKLTIYCKLAEHAMEKLAYYYPGYGQAWTKNIMLPGSDIAGDHYSYAAKLCHERD